MKAKLMLAITACMMMLTSTVYAAEGFSDVTKETNHYESIMYLQEKGIITGGKNNEFRPDDKIEVREALTILEKAFGNPDNLPKWNEWGEMSDNWTDYETDWKVDTAQFLGNYLGGVRLETASNLLLSVNGYEIINPTYCGINPEIWGMGDTKNDRRAIREISQMNLVLRGYDEKNFEGKEYYTYLTRAEFCDMVAWMDKETNREKENGNEQGKLEINIDKIEPPMEYIYVGDKLQGDDRTIYISRLLSDCLNVPEWLRESFIDSGGVLYIMEEDEYAAKFPEYKNTQALHVTHPDGKETIYTKFEGYKVAVHEFGHHLHKKSGIKPAFYKELMSKEQDGLAQITKNDYCKTNIYEYFAEAFVVYVNSPKELAKKAPMTYEAIKDICDSFENK